MFALSSTPIEDHPMRQAFTDAESGACVIFEGRVRNRNQGREVIRLNYEGAEALANNVFRQLEKEVLSQFDIREVRCVHRVGLLNIGELAVWIGVLSTHRSPAFDACRFVIDELKYRLPIWKKEVYIDGESEWINHP
jgi:molybdopterin synthase catalytic subunit